MTHELSPSRRALLSRLQAGQGGAPAALPQEETIAAGNLELAAPLSWAQKRLWFLDKLEPGNPVLNVHAAIALRVAVDPQLLGDALNAIVTRHTALRCRFESGPDGPRQVIDKSVHLDLPVSDLEGLPADQAHERAGQLAAEEIRRAFDLAAGCLLRARLLRFGPRDYSLLLTLHHIAADGWSMGVLLRELIELYTASLESRTPQLPSLPIQYVDFARWQQGQSQTLKTHLDYWTEQLRELPWVDLPPDLPRPARRSHRASRRSIELSASLVERLDGLCRQAGATRYMLLIAALATLLHRRTGCEDLGLGSPIAGRNRAELEPLIGCFLNTLVIRVRPVARLDFLELLAQVREVALNAYAHQDLPFEALLDALRPHRSLQRTPLFSVYVNLLNFEDHGFVQMPAAGQGLSAPEPTLAQFDLALYAGEQEGGSLSLLAVYDLDLYEHETIGHLLQELATLLEGVAANPARPLSQLPLVAAEQLRRLVAQGNRIAPPRDGVDFPFEATRQSLVARFVDQLSRGPERLAVQSAATGVWTYQELAARALEIADSCRGRGMQRVGLLLGHDGSTVAALLGVLAAGCAYVPLDARHPKARLDFIMDDAQLHALVTDAEHSALAVQLSGGRPVIRLDEIARGSPPRAVDELARQLLRTDVGETGLAYLLYTSGSAGRPKGVLQSHGNVLRHIAAYSRACGLGAGDRLAWLASYGFDAAVMDIFGALLNGASLLPLDIVRTGTGELRRQLRSGAATVLHFTPSVFRLLVDQAQGDWSHCRLLVLGGEPVRASDVELYRTHLPPDCLLVNGLGPTESTVALQMFLDQRTPLPGGQVPVGYPVEGIEVRLLDPDGREVSLYEQGEITIYGSRVALGYWGREQETNRAFGQTSEGCRFYRTGDLGRRLADGSIEFAGRKDRQVKVRGQRVESAEVEQALAGHPDVARALVGFWGEGTDLAGWVVPVENRRPDAASLWAFLQQRLPRAMVPTGYALVERFPLTANGKLNTAALPQPQRPAKVSTGELQSAVQTQLASLWMELLPVATVGPDDEFFALGGQSLVAVQLVTRIRQTFRVDLPLRAAFDHPTLAAMAECIERTPPGAAQEISRNRRESYRMSASNGRWVRNSQDDREP